MTVSNLWTAWPIAGPWHLSPLSGGTNNLVWRVETADGQFYVLRLAPDSTRIPRIRYEAALLHALYDKQLPFLLPQPTLYRECCSVVYSCIISPRVDSSGEE